MLPTVWETSESVKHYFPQNGKRSIVNRVLRLQQSPCSPTAQLGYLFFDVQQPPDIIPDHDKLTEVELSQAPAELQPLLAIEGNDACAHVQGIASSVISVYPDYPA